MTLLERYIDANTSTYVGRVRTTQTGVTSAKPDGTSTDTVLTRGVDLMDAFQRSAGNGSDDMQTEFTRNAPGAYKYGGGGKIPGTGTEATPSANLTRWTSKALEFAFTNPGLTREGVAGSLFDLFKNRIGANHKYTPASTGTYAKFNTRLPTSFQQERAKAGTSAPSPTTLNG